MARRNQNTFIKRQKELKRVKKAREKMARRHGKKTEDMHAFEGPRTESLSPPEDEGTSGAETEGMVKSGQ